MRFILAFLVLLAPSGAVGQTGTWTSGNTTCVAMPSQTSGVISGTPIICSNESGNIVFSNNPRTPDAVTPAQKSSEAAQPIADLGHGTRELDRVGLGIKP